MTSKEREIAIDDLIAIAHDQACYALRYKHGCDLETITKALRQILAASEKLMGAH